jgi:hypothetical protein
VQRPAKSHISVCKYTPQSFYDTLELSEVKRILVSGWYFSQVFLAGWHRISGYGPVRISLDPRIAWPIS